MTNTQEFLEAFLPELQEGECYVMASAVNQSRRVNSLADAAAMVKPDGTMFHCVSTQDKAARKIRSKEGAQRLQCLFFDLDVDPKGVGGAHKYASLADAELELDAFRSNHEIRDGFNNPTVVRSGGGLHVYWRLAEPISAAAWESLSVAAHAAIGSLLRLDPSTVRDTARIMRTPGSFNGKPEVMKPVTIEHFNSEPLTQDVLDWLSGFAPATARPTTTRAAPIGMLFGSKAARAPSAARESFDVPKDVLFADLIQGCAVARDMVVNYPTLNYNDWFHLVNLAYWTADGLDELRAMSAAIAQDLDPVAELEEKIHQVETSKGPILCETIRSEACKTCRSNHRSAPLEAGRDAVYFRQVPNELKAAVSVAATEDSAVLVPLPPGYTMNDLGIFKVDEHGKPAGRVCLSPMFLMDPTSLPDNSEPMARLHYKTGQKPAIWDMPLTLGDATSFGLLVAGRSIPFTANRQLGSTLMKAWASQSFLQVAKKERLNYVGWDSTFKYFQLPDRRITVESITTMTHPLGNDKDLLDAFKPVGTMERWQQQVREICIDSTRVGVFSLVWALGGVRRMMEIPVLPLVVLYSGSTGTGKTFMQYLMQSVYGPPRSIPNSNMTAAAAEVLLQNMGDAPLHFDELTSLLNKRFSTNHVSIKDLIDAVSMGKGKLRSNPNLEQKGVIVRCGATASSNKDILQYLSSDLDAYSGQAARVFQVEVPSLGTNGAVDLVAGGHAGPIYLQALAGIPQPELAAAFANVRDDLIEVVQARGYNPTLLRASTNLIAAAIIGSDIAHHCDASPIPGDEARDALMGLFIKLMPGVRKAAVVFNERAVRDNEESDSDRQAVDALLAAMDRYIGTAPTWVRQTRNDPHVSQPSAMQSTAEDRDKFQIHQTGALQKVIICSGLTYTKTALLNNHIKTLERLKVVGARSQHKRAVMENGKIKQDSGVWGYELNTEELTIVQARLYGSTDPSDQ